MPYICHESSNVKGKCMMKGSTLTKEKRKVIGGYPWSTEIWLHPFERP
jgi:hypothetical protein